MNIFTFIKRNTVFCLGMVMLIFLLFMTFFGEYLPMIDRELKETDYIWKGKIPQAPPYEPSDDFPLGTDRLGRDMLSLIIVGAKETLLIIVSITVIRYLLAIPLAFLAHKKWFGVNMMLSWLNGFLSYVPTIILLILLATLPPILTSEFRPLYLVFIISLLEVGRVAEMFKIEFDQIATKEFITSGTVIGASTPRMLKSYFMPFLYGKLAISMVGDLGKAMFLLGQIGFLDIFISQNFVQVDPGEFEFQNASLAWPMHMVNAFNDIRSAIWIPFFPALAMTYVIFTFNIIAQGLQKFAK